jgi:hypothetical protein
VSVSSLLTAAAGLLFAAFGGWRIRFDESSDPSSEGFLVALGAIFLIGGAASFIRQKQWGLLN